jgi:hypothetical protein
MACFTLSNVIGWVIKRHRLSAFGLGHPRACIEYD